MVGHMHTYPWKQTTGLVVGLLLADTDVAATLTVVLSLSLALCDLTPQGYAQYYVSISSLPIYPKVLQLKINIESN